MTNPCMTALHLPWYWVILLWAVSCEGWTTMVTANQGKWLFRWHNWLHPHLPALKTNPGQNIFRSFSSFVSVEMWCMFVGGDQMQGQSKGFTDGLVSKCQMCTTMCAAKCVPIVGNVCCAVCWRKSYNNLFWKTQLCQFTTPTMVRRAETSSLVKYEQ